MTQDHPIDLRNPRTHRTGRHDVGTNPAPARPLSMVYGGGGMFGIGYCVGVAHGLASSLAIVFWNTASINVPLSGCDVLVAAPINTQPLVFLDTTGAGVAPFPIPNDPLLANLDVFFQSLVIDVNGPFLGLGALSNGLAARIGN